MTQPGSYIASLIPRYLAQVGRQLGRGSPAWQVKIPLSEEPWKDGYSTAKRRVRLGRLFEDIDAVAGGLAYAALTQAGLTAAGQESAPVLDVNDNTDSSLCSVTGAKHRAVTAVVDSVRFLGVPRHGVDIGVDAQLVWQGSSSMEIEVALHQDDGNGANIELATARLVFVVRSPDNQSVPLPRLVPENPEGDARAAKRKESRTSSLMLVPPSGAEATYLHKQLLGLESRRPMPGVTTIANTTVSTTIVMHPEYRNIHGTIFGGYIMRMSFETAWCAAMQHAAGRHPNLTLVEDIYFLEAVPIGCVLSLDAQVVFADPETNKMVVAVECRVAEPELGSSRATNRMLYHFSVNKQAVVSKVVPQSYHEGIRHLEGRRKFILHSQTS